MNTTTQQTDAILQYEESPGDANRFSVNIKGRGWLLSILHNGEQFVAVQRENMRRLVACWNACVGIDTQMLEGFSPGFLARYPDRVLAERKTLVMQNKQLLTRLVQALEASGYSISGPTDTRAAENGEPAWVCNARAEVANAMVQQETPGVEPIALLSERMKLAIDRYLNAALLREQNGTTLRDREEARSYAVELVTAILVENPKSTGFDKFCEKLAAMRQKPAV